jgi:hypothetical protein
MPIVSNVVFWPVPVIAGLESSRESEQLEWQVSPKPDL